MSCNASQSHEINTRMAAGEISSHQAAASVYIPKETAQRFVEKDFDLDELKKESDAVKAAILDMGEKELANDPAAIPPRGKALAPIDLSPYPLFRKLATKRCATFERYFCHEPGCEVDFTRLDALLRHSKNSHGDGKRRPSSSKGKNNDEDEDVEMPSARPASKKRAPSKSNTKRTRRDVSDSSDDDDDAGGWDPTLGEGSDDDSTDDDVVRAR